MSSIMAEQVVADIKKCVSKGERANLYKLQRKHGYSHRSARALKVKETVVYQQNIPKTIALMNKIIDKSLKELDNRDLTKERYTSVTDGLDKLVKNSRLLQEKSTENVSHQSKVVVYGSDDFLALQSKDVDK